MKVTIDWLREYAPVPESWNSAIICEKLTMSGSEVEHIEVGAETTLTIEVTSNRTDCLSVLGLARELSVLAGISLKEPAKKEISFSNTVSPVLVKREDEAFCPYYTAHTIVGVKNCESPDWLKRRLIALGLRPLNAIVDISNYVLFEYGQPMHTFDREKIAGEHIIVRKAIDGEKLLTLDGKERSLSKEDYIIADEQAPLALAGVMGGETSAVDEKSRTILLESAWFHPQRVKEASLRHSLNSDSSFRFERGVNPENVLTAARRCVDLIIEICGGSCEENIVIDGKKEAHYAKILFRLSRLNRTMGITYNKEQVMQILSLLGFKPKVEDEDTLLCIAPSFRPDCEREADIIEEIARVVGFEAIPEACNLPLVPVTTKRGRRIKNDIHSLLRSQGYYETITDSFVPENKLFSQTPWETYGSFVAGHPVRKGEAQLRSTLLLSLLKVYQSNAQNSQGQFQGRFFEDAHIYLMNQKKEPAEEQMISFIDEGYETLRNCIELLTEKLNTSSLVFEAFSSPLFAQNGGACLKAEGKLLLVFGVFNQETLHQLGIKKKTLAGCELRLKVLEELYHDTPRFQGFSRYPGTLKDLSLLVDEKTLWKDVEAVVKEVGGDTLAEIRFLDEFRGKSIPTGKKSLNFSLVFQSHTETLQWEEVQKQFQTIIDEVCKQAGAELRTVEKKR